jgi:hypothetical protein
MNGGSLVVDGKTLVQEAPSDRRGVKNFTAAVELDAGPHAIELTYFHTGRKAELVFEMAAPQFPRGPVPSAMLSVSKEPRDAFASPKVDAALAARGRDHFSKLGCANCHDDLKLPRLAAPDFARLDANRGCLTDSAGPRFDLSAIQRELIVKALPAAANPPLDDTQRIHKTLASLNCIACHERGGLGAPSQERRVRYFTSTQPSLGDQGRIPPPLTHVGAKLSTSMALGGAAARSDGSAIIMDAAMPQFGDAQVGHSGGAIRSRGQARGCCAAERWRSWSSRKQPVTRLVGTGGLGCIVCHAVQWPKSR